LYHNHADLAVQVSISQGRRCPNTRHSGRWQVASPRVPTSHVMVQTLEHPAYIHTVPSSLDGILTNDYVAQISRRVVQTGTILFSFFFFFFPLVSPNVNLSFKKKSLHIDLFHPRQEEVLWNQSQQEQNEQDKRK
jgi:hypothetical protein